jgi:hypothetical protein
LEFSMTCTWTKPYLWNGLFQFPPMSSVSGI